MNQVARIAEEARLASLAAEESMEGWRQEEAALKFVELAKYIKDPVARRAIALVGHSHALKAQSLGGESKKPTEEPIEEEEEEEKVPVRRASESAVTRETTNLWACDILALERRLYSLSGTGRSGTGQQVASRGQPDTFYEWWSLKDSKIETFLGTTIDQSILEDGEARKNNENRLLTAAKREEALTRGLKQLSDENARLRRRRDELDEEQASVRAVAERVDEFKVIYQQKFQGLKQELADFRHKHPSPKNPANALVSPIDPEPPKPYPQLEAEIANLRKLLSVEREYSSKKDTVIERYEHWYRALKDSAKKRTSASLSLHHQHILSSTSPHLTPDMQQHFHSDHYKYTTQSPENFPPPGTPGLADHMTRPAVGSRQNSADLRPPSTSF